ncbi:MAG: 3D domain-containing protein [Firmicutes bacterium]|nr:3D domain-containing protein [Bacillota bacterium]
MPAAVGRVAVDPRYIPLGTWLYVEGYGLCQACDTGGAVKGWFVDVYFNSNAQCNRWGVKHPRTYILR